MGNTQSKFTATVGTWANLHEQRESHVIEPPMVVSQTGPLNKFSLEIVAALLNRTAGGLVPPGSTRTISTTWVLRLRLEEDVKCETAKSASTISEWSCGQEQTGRSLVSTHEPTGQFLSVPRTAAILVWSIYQ